MHGQDILDGVREVHHGASEEVPEGDQEGSPGVTGCVALAGIVFPEKIS